MAAASGEKLDAKIKISFRGNIDQTLQFLQNVPRKENDRWLWGSDELEKGTFELIYQLEFKPSIDDYVKDGAIWSALNECAKQQNLSQKFFIARLLEYLHSQKRKIYKKYVGVAQINCSYNTGMPSKIKSFNGDIRFVRFLKLIAKS